MAVSKITSREEWLVARKELLANEKELTRAHDKVNAQRRALPMVEIDKEYEFEGPGGKTTLRDLFDGRPQLIVYHFMWRWDQNGGCPTCSLVVDNVGNLAHLHATNTSFSVVSRGQWPDVDAFRQRMGWTVPFFSSYGSDFNYDFHVTLDPQAAPLEYNYAPAGTVGEAHGISVFLNEGGRVFHTYSAYARGCEFLLGTFQLLDITPLGRQEEGGIMSWVRHHDQYPTN